MFPIKNISIPSPCHQPWQQMEQTEQGRYCLHCSKTVIDFSKMKPNEIINYLANNSHVCGRFEPVQMHRVNNELAGKVRFISSWKRIIAAASILGAAPFFKAEAKPNPHKAEQAAVPFKSNEQQRVNDTVPGFSIRGRVIGKDDSLAIPGAFIRVKGTNTGTEAGANGIFKLNINGAKATLIISFIGYASQEVEVDSASTKPITVIMSPTQVNGEVVALTGIVITSKRPFYVRWYNRLIRRPIHRLFN